jgi:hypothetical protein
VVRSVFAPVRPKVDLSMDKFAQGYVMSPRLAEAFDGPCPVLGGHDVRYKLQGILDRAFHPFRYLAAKSQFTWE